MHMYSSAAAANMLLHYCTVCTGKTLTFYGGHSADIDMGVLHVLIRVCHFNVFLVHTVCPEIICEIWTVQE